MAFWWSFGGIVYGFFQTVFVSIALISLGFFTAKKGYLGREAVKVVNFIVINFSVSATAIVSFMADYDNGAIASQAFVFVLATAMYVISIVVSKKLFRRQGKVRAEICALAVALGQVTLFSLPVIKSVFAGNNRALIVASTLSVVFRITLYGYAFAVFADSAGKTGGKAYKKIFLSPVMIATFIGLFVYIAQGVLPQISINGQKYCVLRIDKTFPFLFAVVKSLSDTLTPLAMLLVGLMLGFSADVGVIKDKTVWTVSLLRTFAVPLVCLVLCVLVVKLRIVPLEREEILSLVIGFSAPVSAMIAVYASNFGIEEKLVSGVCFLSVILSVISLPVIYWIAGILV